MTNKCLEVGGDYFTACCKISEPQFLAAENLLVTILGS